MSLFPGGYAPLPSAAIHGLPLHAPVGAGLPLPPTRSPHAIHGGVISVLHRAMVDHPDATHVAEYSKALAALAGLQAKNYQAAQGPQGLRGAGETAGGPQAGPVAAPVSDAEGAYGASLLLQALFGQQPHPVQAGLGQALGAGAVYG